MSNRKKINGLIRGVKIIAFYAMLLVMGFIGLLWFLRPDTSTVEKRTLTKFPALTWSGFWDGSFFSGIDTWYADTYPLRDPLIAANQSLQDCYGIRNEQIVGEAVVADAIPEAGTPVAPAGNPEGETAAAVESEEPVTLEVEPAEPEVELVDELGEMQGNIYITNNCGYGLYYYSQDGAEQYAATMNQVYENVKDKVDLYLMICPISAGVLLDQKVLDDMGCSEEGDAIEYIYSMLDPGIKTVSVFDTLRAHNSEYIYFHTDHHWTQLGAYYAYLEFCKVRGFTPHGLDEFETMEFHNFLGTYYTSSDKSPELAANPDTVLAYVPNGTNMMTGTAIDGTTVETNIVADMGPYEDLGVYTYMTYVSGDLPFSCAHNEEITDGSSVMIVKDSYGSALIPWLVDHYEYLYWVDYRYTSNTISQMVADYGIQEVIFENNILNVTYTGELGHYLTIGS